SALNSPFFFLMIPRPPRSTLFPYRRSSDLVGAGRTELVRALFGLAPITSGRVELHGESLDVRTAAAAPRLAGGLGYVSEDRKGEDRKSTRLNSSHSQISYAVFGLKKKKESN